MTSAGLICTAFSSSCTAAFGSDNRYNDNPANRCGASKLGFIAVALRKMRMACLRSWLKYSATPRLLCISAFWGRAFATNSYSWTAVEKSFRCSAACAAFACAAISWGDGWAQRSRGKAMLKNANNFASIATCSELQLQTELDNSRPVLLGSKDPKDGIGICQRRRT